MKKKDSALTIRLPSEMLRQVKRLCISMSNQEGKVIGVSEFVRRIIMPFVKLEEQQDMFKKKK